MIETISETTKTFWKLFVSKYPHLSVDNRNSINTLNKRLIEAVQHLKDNKVIKTDAEIARKTGYSKAVVSKYLSGKEAVSQAFLDKFCDVFNMEHLNINGNGNDKENRYDVYSVRLKHDRNGKVVLPADAKSEDVQLIIEYLKLMLKSMEK